MRFNSKSLLSTIPMGPLEFECRNIAEIYKENDGTLPYDGNLPVKYLGGGCFGDAYALLNFPGLVLKLCARADDAFPEYIRKIAGLPKAPAWAPVIFTHGGDEVTDVFWCVMPEYASCAYGEAHFPEYRAMSAALQYWSTRMQTPTHRPRYMRRDIRSMDTVLRAMAEDIYGDFSLDIHSGNFMYDTARNRVVFTDPFGFMDPSRKSTAQHADS